MSLIVIMWITLPKLVCCVKFFFCYIHVRIIVMQFDFYVNYSAVKYFYYILGAQLE